MEPSSGCIYYCCKGLLSFFAPHLPPAEAFHPLQPETEAFGVTLNPPSGALSALGPARASACLRALPGQIPARPPNLTVSPYAARVALSRQSHTSLPDPLASGRRRASCNKGGHCFPPTKSRVSLCACVKGDGMGLGGRVLQCLFCISEPWGCLTSWGGGLAFG